MALKAVIDSLDDVPEALHTEYVKKTVGGKEVYVLDVAEIDNHPQVKNLKTAHEKTKQDKNDLKTKLEETTARFEGLPEDFNADSYKQLKAAAEGKGESLKEEQITQIRTDERKKVMKEVQPQLDKLPRLDGEVRRRIIDGGLTEALVEAGVAKEFLPAVRAMLKEKVKIDLVDENDQFDARIETSMGPQKITEFVSDWIGTPEGKVYLGKPTGGDANGSGGRKGEVNPFVAPQGGKINLTAINQLVKENPEKARQMARAANIPDAQLQQYGLTAV